MKTFLETPIYVSTTVEQMKSSSGRHPSKLKGTGSGDMFGLLEPSRKLLATLCHVFSTQPQSENGHVLCLSSFCHCFSHWEIQVEVCTVSLVVIDIKVHCLLIIHLEVILP